MLVKPGDVFGREMGNMGALSFVSCIRAGDAGHRYGCGCGNVLWLLLTWHLTRRVSGWSWWHPDSSAHSLRAALHQFPYPQARWALLEDSQTGTYHIKSKFQFKL